MWLQKFIDFISQPNPKFRCKDTGWPEPGPKRFIAQLKHIYYEPAGSSQIELIQSYLGKSAKAFIEFFSKLNGAVLYADTNSDAAGILIAPVEHWDNLTHHKDHWLMLGEDVPTWVKDSIAFGEIPNSGNFFLVIVSGEHCGKIFFLDHDCLEYEIFANNFEEFIEKVITDPPGLLNKLGCNTRYSDGETETQWIPEAYATGDETL